MPYPAIPDTLRLSRLQPPQQRLHMVLDTDTYNEVDDQFAVAFALRSPEKLVVEALYAAPFLNSRSSSPADGMERSYQEILRLLERLGISPEGFVYRGSTGYLPAAGTPRESEAAADLVCKAMSRGESDEPLYVVAIGAISNVASAILMEPAIVQRIVVVWLGGHALHWPDTREFNLMQDVAAARVVLDCGVPLVLLPAMGVTSHLQTTVAELERHLGGQSAIADYLVETVKGYHADHYAWSKVIWDIASIAYLLDAAWTPSVLVHSPIVTDQLTWSVDQRRHLTRCAYHVQRDPIFRDLFRKLRDRQSE